VGERLRPSGLPPIVGRVFLEIARRRVEQWDRRLDRLEETQLAELRAICQHAAQTEFGRARGLGSVKSYRDFRQQVPVGDYDSFSGAIDRMRRGETNILIPEFVGHFGNSSGSSTQGKPKFLPISDRQIRHQSGSGVDALFRHLAHRGDADFTSGFTLGLFPPITMRQEGPVKITSNPALMAVKKPRISQLVYLPRDRESLEMADYDKKLELIAERYLDYDVRAIAGTTCWFSLLFDKLLAVAARRGRRSENVSQIWPNLRVLLGGGVSATPYLDVLRQRMGGSSATLVDTYNATEGGIYATTDHSGEPGLLMIPDRGVFFEFVPIEEHESVSPRRVPLWEVEVGQTYAIIVTTPSGLYAYKLGDLVRFTSRRPLRVEFVGRTAGCLSTTQELTTHAEIERAVAAALKRHPAVAVDFAAGADVGVGGTARSRYVLFVEFNAGRGPLDVNGFVRAFDEALCQENRVYREHRTNNTAILAPELVLLPVGSVRRFMSEVRGGNVQAKFPRVVEGEYQSVLRKYATGSGTGSNGAVRISSS
jgi:GH3 auxin-responsive promoter